MRSLMAGLPADLPGTDDFGAGRLHAVPRAPDGAAAGAIIVMDELAPAEA